MATGKLELKKYFSVMEGKICRQFKEPTVDSVTRVNKNGKTVHEELYDYISGTIIGITTKDSDFGRFWLIELLDGQDRQILQLNYSSGYSNAFLKTLPNVNLEQPVVLIPKQDIQPDGKKKTTLFITQGGQSLKWFYTKDDPNGLPELIVKEGKGKMKGKKTYDDSEIMEFLEEMVNTEIIPNLPVSEASGDEHDEEEVPDVEQPDMPEETGTKTKGGKKKDEKAPF